MLAASLLERVSTWDFTGIGASTILYSRQLGSRYWLDAAGHYARPDVFQLTVNCHANAMIADAPDPGAD